MAMRSNLAEQQANDLTTRDRGRNSSVKTLSAISFASRTFMYVESGEEALGEIAQAIAAKLGLGAPQRWSADEAIAAWGRNLAVLSLGSNSRVRGKTASELGWSPTQRSITQWIVNEVV